MPHLHRPNVWNARNGSSYFLTQTHKARQANAKIAQQLQERLDENRRMSGQLVQLASSVKVREAIFRSHVEASGGESNPAQQVRRTKMTLVAPRVVPAFWYMARLDRVVQGHVFGRLLFGYP